MLIFVSNMATTSTAVIHDLLKRFGINLKDMFSTEVLRMSAIGGSLKGDRVRFQ